MLSSKAKTIESLAPLLRQFKVPKTYVFSTKNWFSNHAHILSEIDQRFSDTQLLAIRSSAVDEDGSLSAKAGEYESALNVQSNDPEAIRNAVDKVVASYQRNVSRSNDDVIVQKMVQNCTMSGVVFTHDLNTGAPYYVINYDDISGLTDTVTSGDGEYANRTLYVHRDSTQDLRSERFQILLSAIYELEQIIGNKFLDIEFAIDNEPTPYLLQARAITTQPNWNRAVSRHIDSVLQGIQKFVKNKFKPVDGIFGNTTVFGGMPDWNPAEMIGQVPRSMAFSLYKTLITDQAWRLARKTMGYTVPEGQPLMVSLAGQPFIDTRLSFHSFLPEGLDPVICEKLVNSWVQKLKEHPELHDKIEFDIAITTYSFDIDNKISDLAETVLNQDEEKTFKEALRQQTIALVSDQHRGAISLALLKIDRLTEKQKTYQTPTDPQNINQLFFMIEDCIHLGTIPFSILARHGFIAKTLLLSLVQCSILSMDNVNQILGDIRTIASDLVDDIDKLQLGELDRGAFMEQYGHLRPGTYDISSLRYDQMSAFGEIDFEIRQKKEKSKYELTLSQHKLINQLLLSEGFTKIDSEYLLNYVKQATAGREYGKFIFTRSVSNILEMIARFGEYHGLSRDELSHLDINDLLNVITSSTESSIEDHLRQISETNTEQHTISAAIRLPQVLFDEAGVHIIPFQVSHPNFITNKKITATCILLRSDQTSYNLSGQIVLIENADPGFDWIFSQPISGLITKYGGANSHMAIRCAEFSIPAAIGCGEQRFEVLQDSNQIMLDCSASLIKTLH